LATATYVEFVESEVTLYENDSFYKIPVRRRGNLEDRAELVYTLTNGTAKGSLQYGKHDFYIAPPLQRVVFAEGQAESCKCGFWFVCLFVCVVCNIVVFHDSVFEGSETFFISLATVEGSLGGVGGSQAEVVLSPNSSLLTVNIVDPEDGEGVRRWEWHTYL